MTNNKMFKILNDTVYFLEIHIQSQQSQNFFFLEVPKVFKTMHFSRAKSLNLADIRIVRFGLLRASVASEVPTGRGEITGLAGVSPPAEFPGSSRVL